MVDVVATGNVNAYPVGRGVGVEITSSDPGYHPTRAILPTDKAFTLADEILSALDAGGQAHELIIALGDCSFSARCRCGVQIGNTRPDQSFDEFSGPWERHVMQSAN